jgi:hypothetical protein
MSALAGPYTRTADRGRRPSVFGLAASVLAGGFTAGLLFWAIGLPLGWLSMIPLDGQPFRSPWLPWQVEGMWALVAAVGWGSVTCVVTAEFVCEAITRRRTERPATEWAAVSVAVGGYAGLALGSSSGTKAFYAVGLGAVTLWLLAFDVTGRPRVWRWPASRRVRMLTVAGALLVALSYSVTHAFLADGSATPGNSPVAVRVGQSRIFGVGLDGMRVPITVQSVTLTGPGSANVRVGAIALNLNASGPAVALSRYGRSSGGHGAGLARTALRQPFRVPAGRSLWISVRISLRACQSATLDTMKLGYTVLGVRTSASIPLSGPMTLICVR